METGTVVLSFDDCCLSQRENVMPLLLKYGFDATFFICRFNDEWRSQHEADLMTAAQLKELSDAGFEIGNHTWNHPDLRTMDRNAIAAEIDRMDAFLQTAGIPRCTSFAYPGGPYTPITAEVLREKGYQCARSVGPGRWTRAVDPMNVPAVALDHDNEQDFLDAIHQPGEDQGPVMIVFHGVPDPVHEWVNTPPEIFEKRMKYLHDHDFRVISMRTAYREIYQKEQSHGR